MQLHILERMLETWKLFTDRILMLPHLAIYFQRHVADKRFSLLTKQETKQDSGEIESHSHHGNRKGSVILWIKLVLRKHGMTVVQRVYLVSHAIEKNWMKLANYCPFCNHLHCINKLDHVFSRHSSFFFCNIS